jgi:GNAT superfamily N-acetyltransferase
MRTIATILTIVTRVVSVKFRLLSLTDLGQLERDFPQPKPGDHAARLELQAKNTYSYICAEVDERIVAIELIRWSGPQKSEDQLLSQYPELGSLYVIPDYRSQGIGSRLSDYAEHLVKKRGYIGVGATIKDSNTISIAMHRARGYRPVGAASRTRQHPNEPRSYYIKQFD